jgi:hypothetical protein
MGNSSSKKTLIDEKNKKKYKHFYKNMDLNNKYKFKNKIYRKTSDSKTVLIYDMVFEKHRILKQVQTE